MAMSTFRHSGRGRHWRRTCQLTAAVAAAGAVTAVLHAAQATRSVANVTKGCLSAFDREKDYFPDKVAVEDAANFTVTYQRSYKVVEVRTSPGAPVERYVLLQCGAPTPALQGPLAGAQVVTVPISSVYSGSTTHLAALVDLGRLDVLTGVSTKRFLIGDEILKRASSSDVREFSPASVVDAELVVAGRPSVLMAGGAPSPELAVVRQAGIPVVANHEWLEPTALARAEWLKFIALFLNEERQGQRTYADVKARYRALSARAAAVPEADKPTVMTGRGTRGDFVIAGGRSYVAALITDAGGRYVWADNTATGSVTVDLEAQLARAGSADVWINGGGWSNLAAMTKDEPRYGLFKAYRTSRVWVYERRVSTTGGNDYWSRGITHPDLVLADLVKIFHPALATQHAFQWYMPVPAN